MPSLHHESGPSSLGAQELCPSYTRKEEPNDIDDAAKEGTLLHLICETGSVPENFVFTDMHKTLVENTLQLREEIISGADEVINEKVFNIGKMGERDGEEQYLTFGTADVTALFFKEKKVKGMDYKFGFAPVDPPEINAQVQAYALGMLEEYPWAEEVEFHIYQPRRAPAHTSAVYTRADMPQIKLRIENIILQRKAGMRRVFMHCCRFCEFRPSCPNLREKLHPLLDFYAGEAEDLEIKDAVARFDPQKLAEYHPDDTARFMRVLDFINNVRDSVRDWAKQHILNGNAITGYGVSTIPPRYRQHFNDDRRVAEIARDEFGVDPLDIIAHTRALPKSVIEGVLKDNAPHGKGAATVRDFYARIDADNLLYDPRCNPEDVIYVLKYSKARAAPPKPEKIKDQPVLWTKKSNNKTNNDNGN